ncbi:hypothetical protein BDF20DRAFT_824113 [Mycotypha africana]|uniref:uncharacterized protein n=1 Tax=Mycotypha africana TaxID=64632 RepID=UPI0023013B48|nr:uncharacterized protein BDF20DRAFT_824113 [Mycotypha africana]KAI8973557.1 hypothetical protein BDF20DRAFT_824113 [Mycotypha africana]
MNNLSDLTIVEEYSEKDKVDIPLLEDWLAYNIPSSPDTAHTDNPYYQFCQCCQQSNCKHFETTLSTIHKLEEDARLAAVIGQGLLQRHEQYICDANQLETRLEQKVSSLRTKIEELEDSLLASDTAKQHYLDERNKCMRRLQRTEKLNECDARCIQLEKELKLKMKEIERLSVFKLLAKQADIREEAITAKLEDLKQELAYSRKAELTLESKHKKLKAKLGNAIL